ncbi:2Fe-2S iron-sulfur cluster-binding protein [Sphingobium sp. JS3065]|uniref:2Fe-2S iron-sulfur cluster-binding protein n=1 Tax=Sphingobium sp. JS3065 TaxID=2970925 RepID=UPI0022640BF3|nr:2Fe-2S iron-sulfur cluster-binding protein [Sphingobium sp. JS3065]UZW57539.1 2Fe-2S iron-sulfur cluster-binding protein [Sphingobium sp. JS3065]
MMKLNIISRNGETKAIEAEEGVTLMEAIRNSGFDEMLALCGGCCSCSTCQIYIDDKQIALLEPMQSDEDDLLDSSDHRQSNSRLACQVVLKAEMAGLNAIIAPED